MKLLKFRKFLGYQTKYHQKKLKKRIVLFARLIRLIQLLYRVDICVYVCNAQNIYKSVRNKMQANVQFAVKKLNNL